MLAYDVVADAKIDIEVCEIKKLWLEAFPEDDETTFESYSRGRLANAECFVYICQHELASMAFSITSNMVGTNNRDSETVDFIVGVATAQKWRGRGFASVILRKIAQQAQLCGCNCLMLSTYIPQFYAKLGYKEAAWHNLWRCCSEKNQHQYQNDRFCLLCSNNDLLVLAAYYEKKQKHGWLKRDLDYWCWRIQDADKIYIIKDNSGSILAYAILNKDFQGEELVVDTAEEVFALINIAKIEDPLEICSAELNEKLRQDRRFECVGQGSCQMILPLTEQFRKEYFRNEINFSCLDNW